VRNEVFLYRSVRASDLDFSTISTIVGETGKCTTSAARPIQTGSAKTPGQLKGSRDEREG
jgi:hypothetical protein